MARPVQSKQKDVGDANDKYHDNDAPDSTRVTTTTHPLFTPTLRISQSRRMTRRAAPDTYDPFFLKELLRDDTYMRFLHGVKPSANVQKKQRMFQSLVDTAILAKREEDAKECKCNEHKRVPDCRECGKPIDDYFAVGMDEEVLQPNECFCDRTFWCADCQEWYNNHNLSAPLLVE